MVRGGVREEGMCVLTKTEVQVWKCVCIVFYLVPQVSWEYWGKTKERILTLSSLIIRIISVKLFRLSATC